MFVCQTDQFGKSELPSLLSRPVIVERTNYYLFNRSKVGQKMLRNDTRQIFAPLLAPPTLEKPISAVGLLRRAKRGLTSSDWKSRRLL